MATQQQVVIIGAGIVGCALADELTARGWTDVTVLDQGPVFATGGSTSHAPGLVFQTTGSRTMTRLASATVAKYSQTALGGARCFRPVGGLEVATTPERLLDLRRRHGWAAASGVGSHLLDPGECAALHPLLDVDEVLGGLHIPSDGLAVPVAAAEAQARAAMARGATFRAHQRVTAVERDGGRVRAVHTADGRIPADLVVSCAGMWGPLVGELAGVHIPLVPMAHQYAKTTPVAELDAVHQLAGLVGRGAGGDATLPILRHQDADLYFREHGDRLGIGAYGHRAMPLDPRELDRQDPNTLMPSERTFTPEDFDDSWEAACTLLPALGETKVEEGVNGIFSFTPDGMPLLGEHPDLGGFWSAEAVWITHSAGVAEAVAEWMTTGRPAVGGAPIDLSGAHLDRFDPPTVEPAALRARACRAFDEVYDIVHPQDPGSVPEGRRAGPFGSRQRALGAVFAEIGGWERPLWFEANAGLPEVCEVTRRDEWAGRHWSPVAGAEALVTRRAAGLFDMTPLRRLEVTGPNALGFLQHLTTADLDRAVGAAMYTLMLDTAGGVRADLTVTRLGEQRFLVGVSGRLDLTWLRAHVLGDVTITDVTDDTCCLGLWGPRVREILDGLVAPWVGDVKAFRGAEFTVAGIPVTGLRVSYVGEYGWELTAAAADGPDLWDVLTSAGRAHGLVAAGRHAFSSLRLEKGYRSWGADVSTEHDPDAAGLGFAVKPAKGPFVGRSALLARRERGGPERRLVTLLLDDPARVVLGGEPVRDQTGTGEVVGYVTSADAGYTLGVSIALAYLPEDVAYVGARVGIEYLGEVLPAEVALAPAGALHDPSMTRMRS